jgi:predicted TIM-barrel fold metal-dependent hydrolase
MMIDIFTHILPATYLKALEKLSAIGKVSPAQVENLRRWNPVIIDVNLRLKMMDEFPDMVQVLTLLGPPIEAMVKTEEAVDLAKIANDEMAEWVAKYPDRFAAAAALPMNDMEAALNEVDRAINDLKLRGVQIFTSINDKPLDSPEFLPFYQKMAQYDLPIWIHPLKDIAEPDYPGEQGSKYALAAIIGWPHATAMAMMRLAASGVLEKYPKLKFITHHDGGTVPYLAGRIQNSPFKYGNLKRTIIDSLRLFYNDTAVQGNIPNLMCAYAFCGADHMLLGTDFPMVPPDLVKETIRSINEMTITDSEKRKIFEENARQILKFPV